VVSDFQEILLLILEKLLLYGQNLTSAAVQEWPVTHTTCALTVAVLLLIYAGITLETYAASPADVCVLRAVRAVFLSVQQEQVDIAVM
jgi:hypothetical protein